MDLPKRKQIRLMGYDYSQNGAYFITICTQNRAPVLSRIVGDGSPVPKLTDMGRLADEAIGEIPRKYPSAQIEKYVIMPNHIHLLLLLDSDGGTGDPSPTALGAIIGWLKYKITKEINILCATPGLRQLQRSYYDHIIRNERDYLEIWQYIDENPLKWELDCFYCP